jgi:hypothetical protein
MEAGNAAIGSEITGLYGPWPTLKALGFDGIDRLDFSARLNHGPDGLSV